MRVIRRVLSQVVSNDVFRLVGGDNDTKQFHLLVFGELSHLDELALLSFSGTPVDLVNPFVWLTATTIID